MSNFNIFMNSYKQPENKLTYNFLCLLDNMPMKKDFLEFLLNNKNPLSEAPLLSLESVFGGHESNPDGLIELKDKNHQRLKLYFENKTFRYALTKDQLENHIRVFCNTKNSKLLVITPRVSDLQIIKKYNPDIINKIYFHTWQDIANKLQQLNVIENSFIVTQFIEYGKISGEFEDMIPTQENINTLIKFYNEKPEDKILFVIEKALDEINLSQYPINIRKKSKGNGRTDSWGRHGFEFNFDNKYSMWFFIGLYADTNDHKIPFKKEDTPELAFFLDIVPKNRKLISQIEGVEVIINSLLKQGFEDNIINNISPNKWRFINYRSPIDSFDDFSVIEVKNYLQQILDTIFNSDSKCFKLFC